METELKFLLPCTGTSATECTSKIPHKGGQTGGGGVWIKESERISQITYIHNPVRQ